MLHDMEFYINFISEILSSHFPLNIKTFVELSMLYTLSRQDIEINSETDG